jgi:hypothetical protein
VTRYSDGNDTQLALLVHKSRDLEVASLALSPVTAALSIGDKDEVFIIAPAVIGMAVGFHATKSDGEAVLSVLDAGDVTAMVKVDRRSVEVIG